MFARADNDDFVRRAVVMDDESGHGRLVSSRRSSRGVQHKKSLALPPDLDVLRTFLERPGFPAPRSPLKLDDSGDVEEHTVNLLQIARKSRETVLRFQFRNPAPVQLAVDETGEVERNLSCVLFRLPGNCRC